VLSENKDAVEGHVGQDHSCLAGCDTYRVKEKEMEERERKTKCLARTLVGFDGAIHSLGCALFSTVMASEQASLECYFIS